MLNRAGSVPMKPVELQLKAKGEQNNGHLAKKWDVKIPTRSGWPGRGSSNCVPGCKPMENPVVALRASPVPSIRVRISAA